MLIMHMDKLVRPSVGADLSALGGYSNILIMNVKMREHKHGKVICAREWCKAWN